MNKNAILSCIVLFAMMFSKKLFAQEQPFIQLGIKGGSSLNNIFAGSGQSSFYV
ncbi:hypothetical protein [Sphingobacterium multivorum]|uniref:hypothetical protein n=1 Tax=Sphingobacterium TaxID=28453 RepID=UPI0026954BD0|nr:hypothetical protein [Sphingobacterium multivorum]